MSSNEFDLNERTVLHGVAERSIRHGLTHKHPLSVDVMEFLKPVREERASFITLTMADQLRGCIGALEAHQPLVKDVAEHAFVSAFQDPRFPPLQPAEMETINIKISVLSSPERLEVKLQEDLYEILRPGIDGLIIQEGLHKATFLPSVWEQLPDPHDFMAHLLRKAGLRANYWSGEMKVWYYTTEEF